MHFRVAILVAFTVSSCGGAHILALFPVGSKSHTLAVWPIIEELASRGHNITFVSPFRTKETENIKEIYLEGVSKIMEENNVDWFSMSKRSSFFQLTSLVYKVQDIFKNTYLSLAANTELRSVIRARQVDAVVADCFYNEMVFPMADHLGVPLILHCSSASLKGLITTAGGYADYASVPNGMTDYDDNMNFVERIFNFLSSEIFNAATGHILVDMLDDLVQKDYPNSRSIKEIAKDVSLILFNSNPATTWVRSLPPQIIPVGNVHTRPSKPLSEPFETFADEADDGFIVFTLGSFVPVSSMPNATLQIFLKVFAQLPQRVVWKWESRFQPDISANVLMTDWLPQQDLLGHRNARLLIMHGGILGIQETAFHSVPVLGLPFGNDQRTNMAKVKKENYGLKLDWVDLTEEMLLEAIHQLINNPSFKGNATRVSRLIRDELVPSKETAAYWIEHVIRHNGTKHLQLSSKHMPFYQRYLLDVALFLIIISAVFLCLTTAALRWTILKLYIILEKKSKID